ncbi:MAG: nucleoside 2-deoxyribosyltransferase [Bacteroidaceae bacterium]|nr:nucleoside 2-deoxyribosyltransferase [Bacteroidaceae bacterium]
MAKIYVASSWRNKYYPEVVQFLREQGHDVFDFRNPPDGKGGFFWKDVDPDWENWSVEDYVKNLGHEWSEYGFRRDYDAMKDADVCVLVLPCGRSAHTEAGWMAGAGKKVIAYIPEKQEPELMYKVFSAVVGTLEDVQAAIEESK